MLKNLQRDFRDILTEFDKLAAGQASAFTEADERQRAQLRLREIAAIAEGRPDASSLLKPGDVRQLIERFHADA